jgi:hypothetical protein
MPAGEPTPALRHRSCGLRRPRGPEPLSRSKKRAELLVRREHSLRPASPAYVQSACLQGDGPSQSWLPPPPWIGLPPWNHQAPRGRGGSRWLVTAVRSGARFGSESRNYRLRPKRVDLFRPPMCTNVTKMDDGRAPRTNRRSPGVGRMGETVMPTDGLVDTTPRRLRPGDPVGQVGGPQQSQPGEDFVGCALLFPGLASWLVVHAFARFMGPLRPRYRRSVKSRPSGDPRRLGEWSGIHDELRAARPRWWYTLPHRQRGVPPCSS